MQHLRVGLPKTIDVRLARKTMPPRSLPARPDFDVSQAECEARYEFRPRAGEVEFRKKLQPRVGVTVATVAAVA